MSGPTAGRRSRGSSSGPGVTCGITEVAEGQVEVELVSDGSDASGPGNDMDDMEVLPPLMPGLPPRYVKKGTA